MEEREYGRSGRIFLSIECKNLFFNYSRNSGGLITLKCVLNSYLSNLLRYQKVTSPRSSAYLFYILIFCSRRSSSSSQ